jgi:hypothetical protein
LQREADRLHEQERGARAAATAERGGYGGTHKAGAGPAYEEKRADAERLGREVRAAQEKADSLRATILREEQDRAGEMIAFENSERHTLEGRLAQLRQERGHGEAEIARSRSAPIGLADRLDALAHLGDRHATVGAFTKLIALLILLVDSSPALAKLLMVLGPPTLYEEEAEREDAAIADENAHARLTEVEAHKLDCDSDWDIHYRRAQADAAKIEARRPVIEAQEADAGWRKTIRQAMERLVESEEQRVNRYVDLHNARADDEFEQRARDAEQAPVKPDPRTRDGRATGTRPQARRTPPDEGRSARRPDSGAGESGRRRLRLRWRRRP